jgi:putative tricarboxylic transport membrane protein
VSGGARGGVRERRGGVGDRLVGGALVLVGLAVGAEATTFEVAFVTDPVGPKALPLLAAGTFLLAGARVLWRPRAALDWPERAVAAKMAAAAGAFLAYAMTLALLGFFAATTLVVAALSLLYGAPPAKAFAAAAALAAGLWLLFVQLLGLPLPIGSLWMR